MAAVTTASVWSVWWRWQPRFLFVILMAVTTAYGGDDRIVHRAVTTASQYTMCVCLRYLRSQFGSGQRSRGRECVADHERAPHAIRETDEERAVLAERFQHRGDIEAPSIRTIAR